MRQTRASMIEALATDYVRTARAKGLPRPGAVRGTRLRNSLIVVVTIVGLQLGGLISGAVVTERIFGLPGFGKLTLDSVFTRDYPVIEAVVLRDHDRLHRHQPGGRRPLLGHRPAHPRGREGLMTDIGTAHLRGRPRSRARAGPAAAAAQPARHRRRRPAAPVVLTAVFAPLLAPYPPTEVHFDAPFQRPGTVGFPLGTDDLGRDVLSRVLYGTRASLVVGLMSVLLAVVVGTPLGLVAGYWRRARRARLAADRPDARVPVPDPRGGPRRDQRGEPDQRGDRPRHRPDPAP